MIDLNHNHPDFDMLPREPVCVPLSSIAAMNLDRFCTDHAYRRACALRRLHRIGQLRAEKRDQYAAGLLTTGERRGIVAALDRSEARLRVVLDERPASEKS